MMAMVVAMTIQLPPTSETSLQQFADDASRRGDLMVQQSSTLKGMTLGRGVFELLLKMGRFEDQITTLRADLRTLGDRLEEQLKVYVSQPTTSNDIPLPHPEAFPCLRILNSLVDLVLDQTPDRHTEELKKLQKALKEKCLTSFAADQQQDWQSDCDAICQPFKAKDLTSEAGVQERAQRYQQIEQLRLRILNFEWGVETQPPALPPSSSP